MAKAIALVLLLAVPAVFGAATINFAGTVSANGVRLEADKNVTVKNTEADYSFRTTSMATFNLLSFKMGYAFSGSIDANHNANTGAGSASAEFCMAYFVGPVLAQTVASQKANWIDGGSGASFSFNGAVSTVVSVYESIQEIESNGAVVRTVPLDSLYGTLSSSLSSVKKNTIQTQAGGAATVQYATLNTTDANSPVSLTFVLSDVLGVLNIGGATVTPKSIETIVEVLGWPLKKPTNHLRLNIVAATAAVQNSGSGYITYDNALISGEGATAAFFRAAGHASVDGTVTAVTVRTENGVEGDISGTSSFLTGALQGNNDFQGKFTVGRVTVDLPAGAATFTYDPAAGFEPTNSAARALPLFAFVVAAIAAFRAL